MSLISGSDNYDGSMAEAIETAFLAEWNNFMAPAAAPEPNKQMKLLCVAIAEGVIRHLIEHQEAFSVTVEIGGTTYTSIVKIS